MHDFNLSSACTKLEDSSCFVDVLGPECKLTFGDKSADGRFYRLPDVLLASGQIVACDGIIMEGRPFTRRVRAGRYPVTIAIASHGADERIAFAQLRFSARPIKCWEMALIEGQDRSTLQADHFFGYCVDSGTGCFAGWEAAELIHEASDPEMELFDEITAAMDKVYAHTRSWVHIETPGGSAALFSSGFGDGMYPSYFGLDESIEPVTLVTDFWVSEWLRPE